MRREIVVQKREGAGAERSGMRDVLHAAEAADAARADAAPPAPRRDALNPHVVRK